MISKRRLNCLVRLVPVALACFELRSLFTSTGHLTSMVDVIATRRDAGFLAIVLTLGAALLLREAGRGLGARLPRPRWSAGFLGLWLLCAAGLIACFWCEELWSASAVAGRSASTAQILGVGGWSSVLAALGAGFIMAASLRCARWALRTIAGWCRPPLLTDAHPSVEVARPELPRLTPQVPVADGWSSRGPPMFAALAVSIGR